MGNCLCPRDLHCAHSLCCVEARPANLFNEFVAAVSLMMLYNGIQNRPQYNHRFPRCTATITTLDDAL
ncbi:hypothetical protein E2C01_036813 [Portunus trituberculatus]|uniref:Uncharacterized protein n=1 Tax=Portunus trituberculatus TaxID=210409 RepID=A0A5B7FFC9_PORTR|nr:hypothetical protein [Portunus trituberculatus]